MTSNPLTQWLMETAACTGSPRQPGMVEPALEAGMEAAQHGRLLPLAPLLDAETILSGDGPAAQPAPRLSTAAAARRYDEFLLATCDEVYSTLVVRALGDRSPPETAASRACASYLPILLAGWPSAPVSAGQQGPVQWLRAYRELHGSRELRSAIERRWNGPRSGDGTLWSTVWPEADALRDRDSAGMWAAFGAAASPRNIHERFDHHAGQLYLNAADPQLLPDQDRRIRRLHARRQAAYDLLRRTPEEQHPYLGHIPLSVLVRPLDQLASDLVNHQVSWLNALPMHRPQREVHLHVCWWCDSAALEAEHPVVKSTPPEDRSLHGRLSPQAFTARSNYASTVQGLTALLLDDWREAMRGLPVRFHVHRARRPGGSLALGRGGRRWKTLLRRREGAPPARLIGELFRRETYTRLASSPRAWSLDGDAAGCHWYCCVLAAHDLDNLGLTRKTPIWELSGDPLPRCLNHLIAIEDARGVGTIYFVRPPWRDRPGELRPVICRSIRAAELDPSFETLRIKALDVALGQLETMLR